MLLTIDTGGTKTLVASFDSTGKPGPEHRFATPVDPQDYVAHLEEVIHEHYDASQITAIVIAIPGRIKNNIVEWCGNLPWERFDVAKELHKSLSCPIWVENDANLAGLAEVKALRQQPRHGLYITISTGIGTGLIVDGAIHPALSATEAGHMLLTHKGKVREWEDFASGSAIKKTYRRYARDITSKRAWRDIAQRMSVGFVALIPLLQPEVIIIGGSIGTYFERYSTYLHAILKEKLPPHITVPEIRQAVHPEEAVIYGCYYYGTTQLDLAKH